MSTLVVRCCTSVRSHPVMPAQSHLHEFSNLSGQVPSASLALTLAQ